MDAQRLVTIRNKMGMHVRPATALADTARRFSASIQLVKDGQPVDAKSCIELLTLAAVQGTELVVRAHGSDAVQAVQAVADLIDSGFGEG
jgi:phosphotransferase system HPr (HPr) family protein